jgi:protein phosphatase
MHVDWAASSHPGMRRDTNEDSYCARPDLGLYVVADGMGGHVAGEVASRLAIEEIAAAVGSTAGDASAWPFTVDPVVGAAGSRLRDAFRRANHRLAAAAAENGTLRGMATTASAVLVGTNGEAALAHIGDTRIYLARDGRVERLTDDHSWVEEQVRAGILDRIAAERHPWRNVVTRALSGGEEPLVDLRNIPLQPGDRLLICTDGLHGVIGERRVSEVLDGGVVDLQSLCDRLIAEANEAGGPDNITMIALAVHAA